MVFTMLLFVLVLHQRVQDDHRVFTLRLLIVVVRRVHLGQLRSQPELVLGTRHLGPHAQLPVSDLDRGLRVRLEVEEPGWVFGRAPPAEATIAKSSPSTT
jgi:hypothetical protein